MAIRTIDVRERVMAKNDELKGATSAAAAEHDVAAFNGVVTGIRRRRCSSGRWRCWARNSVSRS
jgi:hypothetical protein